jgi:CRISPR-associated protein Cmr5
MKTREQERMQLTWERLTDERHFGANVETWAKKEGAKKYLTAIKKTPPRIHSSGLGQALAFLRSRGDTEAQKAEKDISALTLAILGKKERTDLLEFLRNSDASFLFLATEEAMLVCGWLTRYLTGAGVKSEDEEAGNEANGIEASTD